MPHPKSELPGGGQGKSWGLGRDARPPSWLGHPTDTAVSLQSNPGKGGSWEGAENPPMWEWLVTVSCWDRERDQSSGSVA